MGASNIQWTDVPGCPDLCVNRSGDMRGPSGKTLKQQVSRDGYHHVMFRRKKVRVHRAVLLAFVGLPHEGYECRHLDGDKSNNELTNLAWGTREQQREDDRRNGVLRIHSRRLTTKQAERIRTDSRPARQVAAEFGVSHTTVVKIRRGERYCAH